MISAVRDEMRPLKYVDFPYRVFARICKRERKSTTMKKVICKVEYDTEASELIAKKSVGSFGDPAGYEESLYKTEGGKFFLYTNGGAESIYAVEGIKRMSAANADKWIEENK